jgi:hypothetical protein
MPDYKINTNVTRSVFKGNIIQNNSNCLNLSIIYYTFAFHFEKLL